MLVCDELRLEPTSAGSEAATPAACSQQPPSHHSAPHTRHLPPWPTGTLGAVRTGGARGCHCPESLDSPDLGPSLCPTLFKYARASLVPGSPGVLRPLLAHSPMGSSVSRGPVHQGTDWLMGPHKNMARGSGSWWESSSSGKPPASFSRTRAMEATSQNDHPHATTQVTQPFLCMCQSWHMGQQPQACDWPQTETPRHRAAQQPARAPPAGRGRAGH